MKKKTESDALLGTQARLEISQRRYFELPIQALNDANTKSAMLVDRMGTVLMINATAAQRQGTEYRIHDRQEHP